MPKDSAILTKNNSILLVLDMQEKFRPAIFGFEELIYNTAKLIKIFQILKIPIIMTEQYPKGLGKTVMELNHMIKGKKIEKTEFSCFDNNKFKTLIKKYKKKNLIITGVETHICILKTILEGIKQNYNVHLVVDATSSRKRLDKDVAIKRAEQSNAFMTTTETIVFQLMNSSKDENFKEISKIIK